MQRIILSPTDSLSNSNNTPLKSFVVDQIYTVKKRSNDKVDELLTKNIFHQIEFLKQELKSKVYIIEK